MFRVGIIGGGLAGLVSASLLARTGFEVSLFEKKKYPFHRVCGEYVSNEVKDFLINNDLFPANFNLSEIQKFQFTSPSGNHFELPLDLGAFGISRFEFDHFLVKKARSSGASIHENVKVLGLNFNDECFTLELSNGEKQIFDLVIGAYGKNSNIDKQLNRSFTQKRSPYLGVKYHIKTDFPEDLIALHNFDGGYCGVSAIEDNKFNMCYLSSRHALKKYGTIQAMEENSLRSNPYLDEIFKNSEFIFDKPEVINEFSFAPKKPVENHVLMAGDTAGLITPLCGNGMAMAIHAAALVSKTIQKHCSEKSLDRSSIEREYSKLHRDYFQNRLWVGRHVQKLFGSHKTSEIGARVIKTFPIIGKAIMKRTHGQPF